MDLRQTFAINLRRLRHERGRTQENLAHEAEISRSHMSEIERGNGGCAFLVRTLRRAISTRTAEPIFGSRLINIAQTHLGMGPNLDSVRPAPLPQRARRTPPAITAASVGTTAACQRFRPGDYHRA
jgi:DNA-binding XRE family transcriptional regulator